MDSNFSVNRSDHVFEDKVLCYESGTNITRYLLFVVFGSLSVLITCGNLLVITSIIYFKQLHTPTNFLILSLAVTDLLVGVLILPSTVIPVNFRFCLAIINLDFYLSSSSVWNLCFISVDRYFAVCQPLRYRTKINVRVIVIMILLSWTLSCFSLGFSLPILADVFCFYLPAITMCGIYIKILIVAQRQTRSIQNTICQSTKSESKMERKATKTLAIVMGVFLICWTPFYIFWALFFWMTNNISFRTFIVFKFLGFSNSMLNPFIYGFFYSWFRSAFRMIICGKIFEGDFTHSKLS